MMYNISLRSRRLEVLGAKKTWRARGRHACLPLARPFFIVPTTSIYYIIVFENVRFVRPHVHAKTAFSKSSTLETSSVFIDRFHRIRVDGSRIRKEKVAFSNQNGFAWTGP